MAIQQFIDDGPSKWDLMLGLFDNTMSKPRAVDFTLHDGTTLKVVLNGLKRESGSGEDWCFEGHAPEVVQGYFNIRRRKGHVNRFYGKDRTEA